MMRDMGADVVRRATRKLRAGGHRKTGDTEGSVAISDVTDDSVVVRVGHAGLWIEKGTRPHRIEAKRAKALRFVGRQGRESGQARLSGTARRGATDIVFVPRPGLARGGRKDHVNHPGTKADPFMEPAARETLRDSGVARDSIVARWNGAA